MIALRPVKTYFSFSPAPHAADPESTSAHESTRLGWLCAVATGIAGPSAAAGRPAAVPGHDVEGRRVIVSEFRSGV